MISSNFLRISLRLIRENIFVNGAILGLRLKLKDAFINVLELRVAVGMLTTFIRFGVALAARRSCR